MADATAHASPTTHARLPLALAIALRELRAGASGLIVFVLCIALGVAAVAAIGSLAAAFDEGLARQGRTLVGGDLSFERVHEQTDAAERAALEALGTISESASLRAMARNADGKSALVEVKAVDPPIRSTAPPPSPSRKAPAPSGTSPANWWWSAPCSTA